MIKCYNEIEDKIKNSISEVFWQTSVKKEFKNSVEQNTYYNVWLGYYLKYFPDYTFVEIQDNKIVSYIIGAPDARLFLSHEKDWIITSEELFFDFKEYDYYAPHFHINTLPLFQGNGYGKHLTNTFENYLKSLNKNSYHLVTLKGERNNQFYEKNNFVIKTTKLTTSAKELIFYVKAVT